MGVARRRGVVPVLLKFPQRLQMYAAAPTLELSIEDFEAYAIDRLQGTRASPALRCAALVLRFLLVLRCAALVLCCAVLR